MPQKNSHKIYFSDGFYHVYNRGVEKRNIFEEERDYVVLLHLLKTALIKPEEAKLENERTFLVGLPSIPLQGATLQLQKFLYHPRKNFYGRVKLLCYCLIPNHFHFLIKQTDSEAITEFMRSVFSAYSMYFNKKYKRVGSLFQGIFKAIDIHDENYFLWLSRYIHRNPNDFKNHPFSSYFDYIGIRNTSWVERNLFLDLVPLQGATLQDRQLKYKDFVESDTKQTIDLENLILED